MDTKTQTMQAQTATQLESEAKETQNDMTHAILDLIETVKLTMQQVRKLLRGGGDDKCHVHF